MSRKSAKNFSSVHDRIMEALGLVLAVIALYLLMCLVTFHPADPSINNSTPSAVIHNAGGELGAQLGGFMLTMFGWSSFVFVLVLALNAYYLLRHFQGQEPVLQVITVPLLMLAGCILLHLWSALPSWPAEGASGNGGLVGYFLVEIFRPLIGTPGLFIITLTLALVSFLWLMGWTLREVATGINVFWRFILYSIKLLVRQLGRIKFKKANQFDLPLAQPKFSAKPKPKVELKQQTITKPADRVENEKQGALPLNLEGGFQLPPLSLLDEAATKVGMESEDALTQNARRIESELKNFGVEGVVTKICPGPVITIYELEPAAGVKTSAVLNLADDLARAMSALAIRIAPIAGRNVIGIELPNRSRQMLSLKEMLATDLFETHAGKLTVSMGVSTSGEPIYADIAKMPHALIAGTTGSGKSVAMNAFILSLLYRMTPDQLRFVMIDPKMLELSIYNDIPHLLTPVITDPTKAATALNWVVKEMENRYRLMAELSVKNIASFNAKFMDLQSQGKVPTRLVQTGFDLSTGQPKMEEQLLAEKPIPHIVVVIDELADLMMVAGKQVELYIARLTQMARASGIHLLVATQRPSVDVVTGLIKANIPTRISFNVTSKIDSRTVLDSMGAEQLLGRGDMLYMANGSNSLQRLHGAFVSEEECNRVADFLRKNSEANYMEDIFASGNTNGGMIEGGGSEGDELYQQAVEVVAREQKASTSFIQRHLKIGYNRAASIIEQMEADGLISAANHVGKRDVIIKKPPEDGY